MKKQSYAELFIPFVVSCAIVLTPMTKLRFSGMSFGILECILLAAFLTLIFSCNDLKVRWRSFFSSAQVKVIALMLTAVTLGSCYRYVKSIPAYGFIHDLLAYAWVVLSMSVVIFFKDRFCNRSMLIFPSVFLMLFCSIVWVCALLQSDDVFWWQSLSDYRFMGLARNPNQMALLGLLVPFFAGNVFFWLVENKKAVLPYLIPFLILVASSSAAGWQTSSGALRGAWLVSLPIYALAVLFSHRKNSILKFSLFAMFAVMLTVFFVQGAGHLHHSQQQGGEPLTSLTDTINNAAQVSDANIREPLWRNGAAAVMHSPIFGLGPGQFSGFNAPFEGNEAHNSYLDLATNTGIVGVSILFILIAIGMRKFWAAGNLEFIAAVVALMIFAMAHHILRHLYVWFVVYLFACISSRQAKKEHSVSSLSL